MKKKIFLRRFTLYFVIILIPIIFTIGIYSFFARREQTERIQENTIRSLSSINETLEIALANATYQSNLFSSNPRFTLSLKKILSKTEMAYSDVVMVNSMNTIINSSLNSNLFIRSIYLSIDSNERFISSGTGILSLSNCPDTEWFDLYTSYEGDRNIWTCKRTYYEYNRPQEVITVFMRFLNAHGVIVVNLEAKRLENFFNQSNVSEKESLFLLNDKNELLMANDNATSFLDLNQLIDKEQIDLSTIEELTPSEILINNQSYRITVISSQTYGLKTISLISTTDYSYLWRYFNTTILLIAICAILLATFLSFLITYKNIHQFNYLVSVLSDAEKGIFHQDSTKPYKLIDEYDLIINGVIKTFINNDYLKTQLAEKQHKKKIAELIALQLQINPHFLFNTLQLLDIEAYQQTKAHTDINTIIQELSTILNFALGAPDSVVTLRDELMHLKAYVDINYRRYKNMFILYYDYEEDVLDYHLFRILLQPLVENSLYHGIRPLHGTRQGYIKLKIYKKENYLQFYILDNGVGMSKEELSTLKDYIKETDINMNHIGISNTHRRLILNFGEDSGLHFQSKKNVGTVISFQIPLITDKEKFHYVE